MDETHVICKYVPDHKLMEMALHPRRRRCAFFGQVPVGDWVERMRAIGGDDSYRAWQKLSGCPNCRHYKGDLEDV